MQSPPRIDRRREPRTEVHLPLCVWGINAHGERFLEEAQARDVSLSGALLSGFENELRAGDVIGIRYGGRQARYRVVWVGRSRENSEAQAAVHRFQSDECPWKDLLFEEPGVVSTVSAAPAASSGD